MFLNKILFHENIKLFNHGQGISMQLNIPLVKITKIRVVDLAKIEKIAMNSCSYYKLEIFYVIYQ